MSNSSRISTHIAESCAVAVLWVLLFELNRWLFSIAAVSSYISWIFLPAALRILSVLLLDWRGVAGLFIGAMFTNHPVFGLNMQHSLALSAISALAPMLAVRVSINTLKVSPNLAGLSARQLAIISTLGAVISVVAHNAYFVLAEAAHDWLTAIVPMLFGDLIGTFVTLHLCSAVLRRLEQRDP